MGRELHVFLGLGNPGRQYHWTRHNFGFLFIDRLARAAGIAVRQHAYLSRYGEGTIRGRRVLLMKPQTYMNRSGDALRRLLAGPAPTPASLWVAHDDLDLDLGRLRIRMRGGSGGHRGVHSIAEALGSNEFGRFRLGIGRPPGDTDSADYVLSPFAEAERETVDQVLDRAVQAAHLLLEEGAEAAMTRFNV